MTALLSIGRHIRLSHFLGGLSALIVFCITSTSLAQEISGTDTIGPRSSHIFTLRIPPDPNDPNDFGDTLPPGSGIFYQYGIFDTGANTVAINNVSTSDGMNTFISTANLLDLCGPGDVDCGTPVGNPPRVPGLPVTDLRLWGLSRIQSGGGAPLDTPEAEVFGLTVRVSPIVVNLIGAPVANNVVAYIDYTNVINNADVTVPGADITFYPVGDAGIPTPLYSLQLARFGLTTPTIEGATRGSLYSIVNFDFISNGNSVATGDMLTVGTGMREARVLFDTGNTSTQITQPVADALGITSSTPVDDTLTINLPGGNVEMLNCYEISSVEFEGTGGSLSYVISSPLVCVSSMAFFATSAEPHDIILGTNYFEQTQVLVNGPADTLGLYQGVTSNNPPTANAGMDQTVECDTTSDSVTLDGTGSSDPDGDILTYSWTGAFGTASGAGPAVTLPVGVHTVTLTVDDGNGGTDSDDVVITVVDTTAPDVDAGPDVTLEATSAAGAPYDVSSQVTAFDTCSDVGIGFAPAPANYPLGDTVVTVTATDNSFNQSTDTMTVTVQDTTPPDLTVPANISVECNALGGVNINDDAIQAFLAGASATDIVDANPVITNDAPGTFPLGDTMVTFTATDFSGNVASIAATVTVTDTTPPDLSLSVSPAMLWPPNHKMIPIGISVAATDICDPNPVVELVLVESSEGDLIDTFDPAIDTTEVIGKKGNDIQLVDGQLYLRAERSGKSSGRVYTITYEATDASGNTATETATVAVPHNQ